MLWLSITGTALLLRVMVALFTNSFRQPQLFESEEMARALLAGRGLTYVYHGGVPYRAYIAPLYPLLCAGIYALTNGSIAALMTAQLIASAIHAGLIGVIAARLFGRPAGIISGFFMAVHPGLIAYSSLKAHPLTVDALCFTLVFWQFLRLQEKRTWRRSLWAGAMVGISMLSRATSAVFLPLGILWLVASSPRHQWAVEVKRGALIVLWAVAVASPWLIRNAMLYRHLVFVSTNWEVFWRGNNPHATGHSFHDAQHTVFETLSEQEVKELDSLPDEMQQARWFRERAFQFIEDRPGAFVRLTLRKLAQFWWFGPQWGVLYPRLWLWGYLIFYLLIVGLAVIGSRVLLLRGTLAQRHALVLLVGFLMSLSFLQSFYYVEGRHRWAVEPLLVLLVGIGAMACFTNLRRRLRPGESKTPWMPSHGSVSLT